MGVIQCEEVGALIERQAREVFDVAPEILCEVMQHATCRADGGGAIFQAEAVERRNFEMLTHGEHGGLRSEGPIIVGADGPAGSCWSRSTERGGFHRMHDLGGAQAFQFREERSFRFDFRGEKITGGQVDEREAEGFSVRDDSGKKVVPLRDEHSFIEVRAGRKDLRDLAVHEFAGFGFLGLFADGNLATGLEQAADVIVGRVKGQAAHGDAVAGGEREVDQRRSFLGVLEKHFVEIAEAEKQKRVLGQFALIRRYCAIMGVSCASANMRREVSQSEGKRRSEITHNAIFREHFAASRVQLAYENDDQCGRNSGGFSVSRPLEMTWLATSGRGSAGIVPSM